MRKVKLTAVTPRGTFTRTTHNPYRFVILGKHKGDGEWEILRWSFDERTAQQGVRYFEGSFRSWSAFEIHPVGGTADSQG